MVLGIFSCAFWPSGFLLWKSISLGLYVYFSIGLFGVVFIVGVFCWVAWAFLYILKIKPFLVASFANILSHSLHCLLIFLVISFAVQSLVSLIRSPLFIFALISIALQVFILHLTPCLKICPPLIVFSIPPFIRAFKIKPSKTKSLWHQKNSAPFFP